MNNYKKIKLVGTKDRIGMIKDVLNAVEKYGVNVVTMEVNPYICIKIEWNNKMDYSDFKKHMINTVNEVEDVEELNIMEYERNEKELGTILNNIDEGIIVVDNNWKITHFNDKAKNIFMLNNKDMRNFDIKKTVCTNLNKNNEYIDKNIDNIELKIENRKNKNVLINIRIIENEIGEKTGIIIIIREMNKVRNLVRSITRPSMIRFKDIIGKSNTIKNTIALAKSVAKSDSSVMIRGESGTGKELFARAIHMKSYRKDNAFVAINCSAIPDALFESEVFGYEKGAFTGANSSGKQGFFELADEGTIFLDEIGDLSIHLQAKILRAIQEKSIRRVGGKNEIPIDVRIISATNKNLEKMIKENTFRADLYYRLNVVPIFIPSLKERKEDISVLSKHFIKDLCDITNIEKVEITDEALKKLEEYSWPGNIRELQNVIERSLNLCNGLIEVNNLIISNKELEKGLNQKCIEKNNLPIDLNKKIESIEKHYLKEACKKYKSSREISKSLGISHTSVINKIKKYNIK